MYKIISRYNFQDAFNASDTYKNSFTYEGLNTLFEYLEDYEEQTGTPIEFDMIALACEYSEYPDAITAVDAYTEDTPYFLDDEEIQGIDLIELTEKQNQKAIEWLEERTQVIEFDSGIIIQSF